MLDNPTFGLPSGDDFAPRDYTPRFSLDCVREPYLVFGSDRFGTFIGGGASLFWSDMLGGHNLATALQVNGSLRDVSALVGYTNLSRRLNWGAALQQIPYVAGRFGQYLDTTGGELAVFEQLLRYRQINRNASLLGAYPFNRVQRLEFGAAYQNVTFDAELRTLVTSYYTGTTLLDVRQDLPTVGGLHLGSAPGAARAPNLLLRVARPATRGPPPRPAGGGRAPRGLRHGVPGLRYRLVRLDQPDPGPAIPVIVDQCRRG